MAFYNFIVLCSSSNSRGSASNENRLSNVVATKMVIANNYITAWFPYPPASEVSREVANLTQIKNLHTYVYGVKEFVCLFVTNFDRNYHLYAIIVLSTRITLKV